MVGTKEMQLQIKITFSKSSMKVSTIVSHRLVKRSCYIQSYIIKKVLL